MIIVSGLHRKTGQTKTRKYLPGAEGAARRFRSHLRALGYTTAFVNTVKERYRAQAAERTRARAPEGCDCSTCEGERKRKRPDVFGFAGVTGYQLISLGTARGNGLHSPVKECATNFLDDAVESAEKKVAAWSDGHKGIVIYKAIKLVRKVTKPTTETVELTVGL